MLLPKVNFLKAKTVILGIESCYLCLCFTGPIQAAETVGTTENPIFEPGKEYHVTTDNEAIGTKSFNVYMPLDYTEDRTWPVIFRYITNLTNLESLDISFTYVDNVEPLLNCKSLQKLNISGTCVKNIIPLKNLPQLDSVSMWNLWLDRKEINELKENLPNLKITDYQWDLYETGSIGRVRPKLRVKLN